MPDEYVLALERAKRERADLEVKRKELEVIDFRIRSLDSFIAQAAALLDQDSKDQMDSTVPQAKVQKPSLPMADLIHRVMDELGINTFRVPFLKAEFVKRGWLPNRPNAGLILRTAALRRTNEFKLSNGEFTRIGRPKKPEGLGLLDNLQ